MIIIPGFFKELGMTVISKGVSQITINALFCQKPITVSRLLIG
jgi:hypothetical protein